MKISPRFTNQSNRIEQGKESGSLTKKESKRLENKEARIQGQYVKDKIDGGGLTQKEADRYDRRMDKQSDRIRNQKHDGQSSFEPTPRCGTPTGGTRPPPKGEGANGPSIGERFGNQADRIAQGVKSGELTHKEAKHLKQAEAKLALGTLKQAIDGGGLTAKEKAGIDARQDKLSERIYSQKHDGQEVGGKLEKRSEHLTQRQDAGAESGALTEKEQTHLDARMSNYDAKLAEAQADGQVTRAERKDLNRMANRISAATFAQKHDAQEVG